MDMDQTERVQRIRDRAYHIWVEAGRPENLADEHWRMAAEAVDGEDAAVSPLRGRADDPVPLVTPNR